MQSVSFQAYHPGLKEGRKTSNSLSLFGMAIVPTDNHVWAMLDPVDPSHLQPAFDDVMRTVRRHGGLPPFQNLSGRVLIAFDGTEYFCSRNLGCPPCLTRRRANSKTERYHAMLAATVVALGYAMTLPLMPEFIAPRHRGEKQDCERKAAKRWLATHGERVKTCGRSKDTVAERVACAKASWMAESESFNVLKSNGYQPEHYFGHGK